MRPTDVDGSRSASVAAIFDDHFRRAAEVNDIIDLSSTAGRRCSSVNFLAGSARLDAGENFLAAIRLFIVAAAVARSMLTSSLLRLHAAFGLLTATAVGLLVVARTIRVFLLTLFLAMASAFDFGAAVIALTPSFVVAGGSASTEAHLVHDGLDEDFGGEAVVQEQVLVPFLVGVELTVAAPTKVLKWKEANHLSQKAKLISIFPLWDL